MSPLEFVGLCAKLQEKYADSPLTAIARDVGLAPAAADREGGGRAADGGSGMAVEAPTERSWEGQSPRTGARGGSCFFEAR